MLKLCFLVKFVNGSFDTFYVTTSENRKEVVLDRLYDKFEKNKMVKVNDIETGEPIILNTNNVLYISDLEYRQ